MKDSDLQVLLLRRKRKSPHKEYHLSAHQEQTAHDCPSKRKSERNNAADRFLDPYVDGEEILPTKGIAKENIGLAHLASIKIFLQIKCAGDVESPQRDFHHKDFWETRVFFCVEEVLPALKTDSDLKDFWEM